VDDEPLARRGLREMLAGEPDIEVVGESPDGIQAMQDLHTLAPDLLFLDVQMPGCDGFEVLRACEADRLPVTIFVTAHDRYALRAFEAHAVGYLLKPVQADRLRAAVEHARTVLRGRRAGETSEAERAVRALLDSMEAPKYPARILIKSIGSVLVVPVETLDWIQADGDYARLHAAGGEHLLRETLHSLEARLDPNDFVRIHRSFLVRTSRVREVRLEDNGDGTIRLEDGATLPVSRTYREALLKALRRPEG
jgi:two-component system LytT family response regulator